MKKEGKTLKHGSTGLWLLVALLVIAVIISLALLASLLMDLSAGEDHRISLEPGETNGALTSFFFDPDKPQADFSVSDDAVVWQQDTRVDLFREAYTAPDGKSITVQSEDSSRVIAPGTAQTYSYTLSNDGNVALEYIMTLGSTFALDGETLPVQVRLSDADGWILGSEDEWAEADALNAISEQQEIAAGAGHTYTLEWRWPYEAQSGTDGEKTAVDGHDTLLGNISASGENTDFVLTITVTAEYAPGAVGIGAGRAVLIGLLLLLGILWLLFLLLLWLRRLTVTCLIGGQNGNVMKWKRRREVTEDRFFFKHIFSGKKTYTLLGDDGTQLGEMVYKLKRRRKYNDEKIEGLVFDTEDDILLIVVPGRVMAIELYLDKDGEAITVDTGRWAAIDRKHNVYSPAGKKEPDEHKCNETEAGLTVKRNGRLETKRSD